jgi:hypothetical protein
MDEEGNIEGKEKLDEGDILLLLAATATTTITKTFTL